jgi:hypothetical protein
MYALSFSSRTFFCCEPGQYGVLPISGYTGICEPVDQPVASSLIATPVSQAGGTGVATAVVQAPTAGKITSTLANGAITTILTTAPAATASSTATGTGSGNPASTAGATGSGSGQIGTVTFHISKGGLIGIVLVAVVVLASLIIFCMYWRKRKANKQRAAGGGGMSSLAESGRGDAAQAGAVHVGVPGSQMDHKSPGFVQTQPVSTSHDMHQGYPPPENGKFELPSPVIPASTHGVTSPNMVAPEPQRWEGPQGRVEMP